MQLEVGDGLTSWCVPVARWSEGCCRRLRGTKAWTAMHNPTYPINTRLLYSCISALISVLGCVLASGASNSSSACECLASSPSHGLSELVVVMYTPRVFIVIHSHMTRLELLAAMESDETATADKEGEAAKVKVEEATHILENPTRVVPGQLQYIVFDKDAR